MTKSTLTMTKSSRSKAGLMEGNIETAAILASADPLGIVTMATFPLSLIALGRTRFRQFEDTLTLRPKTNCN